MRVVHFEHCGAIDPGPCTMYSGIDVLVPWHDNWRHVSYWVLQAPAVLTVVVALMLWWGWRSGHLCILGESGISGGTSEPNPDVVEEGRSE